jgi:hypothetical protein
MMRMTRATVTSCWAMASQIIDPSQAAMKVSETAVLADRDRVGKLDFESVSAQKTTHTASEIHGFGWSRKRSDDHVPLRLETRNHPSGVSDQCATSRVH